MSAGTIRTLDGARWRVERDAAARLFAGGAFLPDAIVSGRTVLRDTDSRKVERVALAGGPVFVKTYRARGFLDALARRFGGRSPAEVELEAGLELSRRGFRVATPLAAGRSGGMALRASTLVTEHVDGAHDLLAIAHDRAVAPARRRGILDAFGRLVAKMHQAGVVHDDLHLGNVLVDESGAEPSFVLVDLRRVRFIDGAFPEAAIVESLAGLFVASFGLVSRIELVRFLRGYLGSLNEHAPALARAHAVYARGCVRLSLLAARRALSATRGDSRFEQVDVDGRPWIVRRATWGPELRGVLARPDVTNMAGVDVARPGVAAGRFLENAVLLEAIGVRAPIVLAAESGGGSDRVVTRARPSAITLREAIARRPDAVAIIDEVAALASWLRACDVGHHALGPDSFAVEEDGTVVLTDVAGVRVMETHGTTRADVAALTEALRAMTRA